MKKLVNILCLLMLVLIVLEFVLAFIGGKDASQVYNADHQGCRNKSLIFLIFSLLFLFTTLCFLVYSLASFVKFILNVNHDKVFIRENVRLLRWTGWGSLIGIVVYLFYGAILEHNSFQEMLKILMNIYDWMLLCVFSLIVAEVFCIGIKLKEEQDLTI